MVNTDIDVKHTKATKAAERDDLIIDRSKAHPKRAHNKSTMVVSRQHSP